MSTHYQCKNCNYKTDAFACIKKHCFAKIRCKPVINNYVKLSRDQSIIYSLLPHTIEVDYYDISLMKNYENIYKNRKILEERLSDKNMKKAKCCSYCKTNFNTFNELRSHILLECFQEEINQSTISINNITINGNIDNCNNSINNSTNINTINNNLNLTLNIETPVSFDKSWDISNIDEIEKKLSILCSDIIYTKLLSKILENKKNLNVVLGKNNDYGFVYKNDDEKYVQMKLNDIVDTSMKKLKDNLIELNDNVRNTMEYKETVKINETKIEKKFNDFSNKDNVKKDVSEYIANIYNKNSHISDELMQTVMKDDELFENGKTVIGY